MADVPVKGRDTMGVKFVGVKGDDSVGAIALYPESEVRAGGRPGRPDAELDEGAEDAAESTVDVSTASQAEQEPNSEEGADE